MMMRRRRMMMWWDRTPWWPQSRRYYTVTDPSVELVHQSDHECFCQQAAHKTLCTGGMPTGFVAQMAGRGHRCLRVWQTSMASSMTIQSSCEWSSCPSSWKSQENKRTRQLLWTDIITEDAGHSKYRQTSHFMHDWTGEKDSNDGDTAALLDVLEYLSFLTYFASACMVVKLREPALIDWSEGKLILHCHLVVDQLLLSPDGMHAYLTLCLRLRQQINQLVHCLLKIDLSGAWDSQRCSRSSSLTRWPVRTKSP